ncbi:MAG: glycosyltransferase family 4 protein [Clostridiales bacterium]|nr:glycosyltransferase family 4 protein [Clostridiales bacterium]
MKKILFVATVPEHFACFHIPCFKMLCENGWEVHAACAGTGDFDFCSRRFTIDISRSPLDPSNKRAYAELKKIIDNGGYDIVHCHTPMGGALARLASRDARKKGTKVFYTAHGFHFYTGAPFLNWAIYYPAELMLSRMTDLIITINKEDNERAKRIFKNTETAYIHGVGCDTSRFGKLDAAEKSELRKKYGYGDDEKLFIYVAEQNKNKNQSMLIRAVKKLVGDGINARLLIVGADNFGGQYKALAEKENANVDFLGVRDDVPSLLKISDIYLASSLREGLPLNVMEAMATGLPVIASDNRGHRELVEDGKSGFIVKPDDFLKTAEYAEKLIGDKALYETLSNGALQHVKTFSTENVLGELKKLYGI